MTTLDLSQAGAPPTVPIQPCGVHLDGDECDCPMGELAWLATWTAFSADLAASGGELR